MHVFQYCDAVGLCLTSVLLDDSPLMMEVIAKKVVWQRAFLDTVHWKTQIRSDPLFNLTSEGMDAAPSTSATQCH